jgi:two-component system, sporulation sensor kinase E
MNARLEVSASDNFRKQNSGKINFYDKCMILARDQELFNKIVEGITDIFYVLDLNWRFVYLNDAAERYFLVQRGDVIGKCVWDVFPQAVQTILYEAVHRAKKNKEKLYFDAPSFSELDVWHAYTIYPGKEYIAVLIQDVTEKKEKQRLSEEFFIRVFNAGHSMLAIKTLDGIIVDANRSWLENTGYRKEEVVGKSEADLAIWVLPAMREKINALLKTGAIYNDEVEFKTKKGFSRIGLLSIEEIEIGSGKYYLESLTDITQQKKLEREMAKLDSLNMIGQMAAGISHEFRNPITTVRGFVQLLSGRQELANIKEYFDIIIEEIDRANSIIAELLTLSRNKALDLKRDNINRCLQKLFPMIQAAAFNDDKDAELELADIPDILMEESEIRQLILNLTRNAIQASPQNCKIKISTYQEKDEVVLAVHDEGSGMDDKTLSQIGTPFFTTKTDGTGMGLVICYRIAERHNAKIMIDTGVNGTTFLTKFKAFSFNNTLGKE